MSLRTETRVGLFVLVALSTFGYAIYQLDILPFGKRFNYYQTYFSDVAGLMPKAEVRIAGVKVGFIDSIKLLPSYQAEAVIAINNRYAVHEDAHVSVKQDGLVGAKYIEVQPGNATKPLLKSGTIISAAQNRDMLDVLTSKANVIAADVVDITKQVKDLSTSLSADDMARMSRALVEATEQLAQLIRAVNLTVQSNKDTAQKAIQDLRDTMQDVRESVKSAQQITSRLEQGQGTIGKLLKDDKPYQDITRATGLIRSCADRLQQVAFVVDAHGEAMQHPNDIYNYSGAKGYFDFRLYGGGDYFCVAQVVASQCGWPKRWIEQRSFDKQAIELGNVLMLEDDQKYRTNEIEHVTIERNAIRLGLQAGKLFGFGTAVRAGWFDGTCGIGVDVALPLMTSLCHWITTVELYDLYGQNRFAADQRPHVKLLNRLYFSPNIYCAFGADDIVSERSSSAFLGLGMRFSSI